MTGNADEPGRSSSSDPSSDRAPGSPRAKAQGCLCSVLANIAYRSGQADEPTIDPRCPMHASG